MMNNTDLLAELIIEIGLRAVLAAVGLAAMKVADGSPPGTVDTVHLPATPHDTVMTLSLVAGRIDALLTEIYG